MADVKQAEGTAQRRAPTVEAGLCCPGIEDAFDTALFRALGDENRVALLIRLARQGRPCTVSELGGCCDVDLSVVSRHLGILRDAGVVRSEKKGRHVYYSARLRDVALILRGVADALLEASSQRNGDLENTGETC